MCAFLYGFTGLVSSLSTLSVGTDVVGVHKYFFATRANGGNWYTELILTSLSGGILTGMYRRLFLVEWNFCLTDILIWLCFLYVDYIDICKQGRHCSWLNSISHCSSHSIMLSVLLGEGSSGMVRLRSVAAEIGWFGGSTFKVNFFIFLSFNVNIASSLDCDVHHVFNHQKEMVLFWTKVLSFLCLVSR